MDGLEAKPVAAADPDLSRSRSLDMSNLRYATSFRLLKIREAFIQGKTVDEVYEITKIDSWFLYQIKSLTEKTGEMFQIAPCVFF